MHYILWFVILGSSVLNIQCAMLSHSHTHPNPHPHVGHCPVGEFLNDCASLCLAEPTCQNPNPVPNSHFCPDVCIKRCECDRNRGLIRDENTGDCIKINHCSHNPEQCTVHEFLNECASVCLAEPTCQNPNPLPSSHFCPLICLRRCECDINRGFIRDETTGNCVRVGECPFNHEQCTANEFLNECASLCLAEATCQNPDPVPTSHSCPEICIRRCECDLNRGFIRDAITGNCIRVDDCPSCIGKCRVNEFLNECASPCIDEPTCQNPNPDPNSETCLAICVRRCECDRNRGFIRNEITGNCIKISDCQDCELQCDPHERQGCKSCCDDKDVATCDNLEPGIFCDCFVCNPTCVCDVGFVRNTLTGQCVLPEHCTSHYSIWA